MILILTLSHDVSEAEDRRGRLGWCKNNLWAIKCIDAKAPEKFIGWFIDEQKFTFFVHDNGEILVLVKKLLKKSLLPSNHPVLYGNCDEILLVEPSEQAAQPD